MPRGKAKPVFSPSGGPKMPGSAENKEELEGSREVGEERAHSGQRRKREHAEALLREEVLFVGALSL